MMDIDSSMICSTTKGLPLVILSMVGMEATVLSSSLERKLFIRLAGFNWLILASFTFGDDRLELRRDIDDVLFGEADSLGECVGPVVVDA